MLLLSADAKRNYLELFLVRERVKIVQRFFFFASISSALSGIKSDNYLDKSPSAYYLDGEISGDNCGKPRRGPSWRAEVHRKDAGPRGGSKESADTFASKSIRQLS